MDNLIDRLNGVFREQKIRPNTFRKFGCGLKRACREAARAQGGAKPFVCGREPFVSIGYEKHTLPRVLILSADWRAGDDRVPANRTAKAVRRAELTCNPRDSSRTRHWRELHEIGLSVLRCFKSELTLENAHDFYAYSNSTKCCANLPAGRQAPKLMFANCQKYIGPEVEILAPDILVTQGEQAEKAIQKSFTRRPNTLHRMSKDGKWYSAIIDIAGRNVLWLRVPHPGAHPQLSASKLDNHYRQLAKPVIGFFPNARVPQ